MAMRFGKYFHLPGTTVSSPLFLRLSVVIRVFASRTEVADISKIIDNWKYGQSHQVKEAREALKVTESARACRYYSVRG